MSRLAARATVLVSCLLAAIGVTLLVETLLLGGRIGFLFGGLFVLAGGLRLYLLRTG